MNKRQLYESIMKNVVVGLNETLKREQHDIFAWKKYSNNIKLNDELIVELQKYVEEYMSNKPCPENLMKRFDKDTLIDIGGYIIEADLYVSVQDAIKELMYKHQDLLRKNHLTLDNIKATKRIGRGLYDIDTNGVKIPIYWDFSIFGINEKFEIKTKCLNGYHQGGITYTKNRKDNKDFILIYCEYHIDENSSTYIIDKIDIKNINK